LADFNSDSDQENQINLVYLPTSNINNGRQEEQWILGLCSETGDNLE